MPQKHLVIRSGKDCHLRHKTSYVYLNNRSQFLTYQSASVADRPGSEPWFRNAVLNLPNIHCFSPVVCVCGDKPKSCPERSGCLHLDALWEGGQVA